MSPGRVLWRGKIWDVIGRDGHRYVIRRVGHETRPDTVPVWYDDDAPWVTAGWYWQQTDRRHTVEVEHVKRVRKRRCTPITEADQ